jgi:hypothetical protein
VLIAATALKAAESSTQKEFEFQERQKNIDQIQ